MSITPERAKFHELLKEFKTWFSRENLVYDIGKSSTHNYFPYFNCKYKTIDIDKTKNPDIVCDVEKENNLQQADGVICMGVTEQCNNPVDLINGVTKLLKPQGVVLFGIVSVAYPLYDVDYFRLTIKGVEKVLKDYEIVKQEVIRRHNEPSYIFVIGRKK